ncbi:hypothetical protein LZQ00_02975 [Sphingobacterium sp. SRCM116780]|uniref:hypothetical protein n=1 Tax=Sphingobacterium sp. SRCM116780 TaxID=2907623 RepID=UPI001F3F88ED|nr:hypothetical protein [Sphingobacterium sp. SRCM116780]UIR56787.1 hypothetical protein LZQ00_02975 [Sphingobacterium sp. SRCM116780]
MKIRFSQLIFLIAIYTPLVLQAQDNRAYRLFDIQRKTGVVDTSGKEIIAPQYGGIVEYIYAKSQWVFHDTNKKSLLFNRNTGQMKEYDDIDVRHLEYRDTFYTRIKDNNSYYLLSEVDDKKIKLPKGWEDVGAVGDFFVLQEYYSAPSTSSKKDKKGRWLPPEVSTMIPLLRSEYEITARGDMAHIVQGNEYIASFETDLTTGKIFLPEKYFSELKLEKINITNVQE